MLHTETNHPSWKPCFAAVFERDYCLFDAAPMTQEEWALPVACYPLIATRCVSITHDAITFSTSNCLVHKKIACAQWKF